MLRHMFHVNRDLKLHPLFLAGEPYWPMLKKVSRLVAQFVSNSLEGGSLARPDQIMPRNMM